MQSCTAAPILLQPQTFPVSEIAPYTITPIFQPQTFYVSEKIELIIQEHWTSFFRAKNRSASEKALMIKYK